MTGCSESIWRRSPAPSGHALLHSMFYLLSFLSKHVEASTCPECMSSDHSISDCALTALEPQQDLLRSLPMENSWQSGPAKKHFRHDVTLQSGAQNYSTTKTICFSFNKGNVLDTQSLVIGNTSVLGVVAIIK